MPAQMQPSILDRINSPADLRGLSIEQLQRLVTEIRARIFSSVRANGGHLASNLGVAELTVALHYAYDFGPYPEGKDRLLWDVGHQCYAHKMLTGRVKGFEKLRKRGHVGGFPMPEESPYDLFAVGHAGTAISTAAGMALGDALLGRNSHVVAVVGDASIVNGMALEGLNYTGTLNRQLLVVLNDNGMSIARPQGAFSEYLERVRVSTTYEEFKRASERIVHHLPSSVTHAVELAWNALRDGLKGVMWPGQIFETLGLKYMGPIDGHDLLGLIQFLSEIKHVDKPVLLHVKTRKGQGYEVCTADPTRMHSPAAFSVNGCRVEIPSSGRSWTEAFADCLIERGRQDTRIVALTAAMPDGTGLGKFQKVFPDRCFDTGISESHLMGMAAGLSKAGMKPVAAIYSTFTQRCFDQVWQEVALNKLPVVLAMDRAGYVGDDGAVHHGFMDQAFLRPMPGMVLMAPSDEAELQRCLAFALACETAAAIRYPRDNVPDRPFEQLVEDESLAEVATLPWRLGVSRTILTGDDATLVVYGALLGEAIVAAQTLLAEGLSVEVVDARFCKPIDGAMLQRVLRPGHPVLTIEDHSLINGFGSAVLEYAVRHHLPTADVYRLGHPDRLIAHARRSEQLAEVGLDSSGIARAVRDAVRARATRQVSAIASP